MYEFSAHFIVRGVSASLPCTAELGNLLQLIEQIIQSPVTSWKEQMTTINQFNIYQILFTSGILDNVIFYKASHSQGVAEHLMKEHKSCGCSEHCVSVQSVRACSGSWGCGWCGLSCWGQWLWHLFVLLNHLCYCLPSPQMETRGGKKETVNS